MTECQGCGAWNESHRALCVLCGTPLAATDEWDASAELPPLPPLPDGGLAASMPSWLRAAPTLDLASPEQPREPALLGARADPRTFLTDDDFPRWLRDLALRESRRAEPAQVVVTAVASEGLAMTWPAAPGSATAPNPFPGAATDLVVPVSAGNPAPTTPGPDDAPAIAADARPQAAGGATRPLPEHRGRSAWETLLLVILFLGVVVAALWALVANGVFSPGL